MDFMKLEDTVFIKFFSLFEKNCVGEQWKNEQRCGNVIIS
jgi:hypothetical protein